MRKKVMLGLLSLVVIAMGAGSYLAEPAPGLTRDNARRLRLGMTYRQVERILGEPGEDRNETFPGGCYHKHWEGEDFFVAASFAVDGDVLKHGVYQPRRGKLYSLADMQTIQEPFLDRVRRRFGL